MIKISRICVLGVAMLAPGVCYAQTKCPWINEATARGILGGPVTLTANVSARGDGTCRYFSQQDKAVHELRISVDIMTDIPKQFPAYLAKCSSKSTPIRAIGNEAVTCSTQGKGEPFAEKVVGRVREQAFTVSVSSSVQDDSTMTPEMRRERANLMAEQVAGILF